MTFYTITEVAATLKVGHKAIRALIRQGRLRAYKIGGVYRVSQDQLDVYLATATPRRPRPAGQGRSPGNTVNAGSLARTGFLMSERL